MLMITLSALTESEIDALASIALAFGTNTIEDTLAECVNFCFELTEDNKLQDAVIRLEGGKDEDDTDYYNQNNWG